MVNKKNILLAAAAVGGGYYLKSNNIIDMSNLFSNDNNDENNSRAIPFRRASSIIKSSFDPNAITESLNAETILSEQEEITLPELEIGVMNTKPDREFSIEWTKVVHKISLEERNDEKESMVKFENIGTKTNYIPYLMNMPKFENGIKIFGGEKLRRCKIEYNNIVPELKEENFDNVDKKYLRVVKQGDMIIVDSKKTVLEKFNRRFKSKGFDLSIGDIELIYYLPEDSNILIPMYQIGNAKSGITTKKGANVLGMIFPGNAKYDNNFNIKDNKIKYKQEKINLEERATQEDGINKTNYVIRYTFEFETNNKPSQEEKDKINFIGNLKLVKKDSNPSKYIFVYDKVSPKNRDSDDDIVLINYVNEYDISKTISVKLERKVEQSLIPTFQNPTASASLLGTIPFRRKSSLSRESSLKSRDNNEYGIEWGEDVIGGSCYSNYVNYMDDKSINRYKWTKPNAWVMDFLDKDNAGLDNLYVDDVDISTYIGHGNGYGFELEGSSAYPINGSLTYQEAAKGEAWGNKDVEYQVWLSCQVLEETYDGKKWYERWGPTFNGLHLICGFQTNASTGTHKHLKYFAKNIYKEKMNVRRAWFNAADRDQPDGTQAVIMGPMIAQSSSLSQLQKQKKDYAAINATTSGLLRAHWNDTAHDLSGSDKKDIPKEDIRGWWRVVHTV